MNYDCSWWLPGGHLQTLWPALQARCAAKRPRFQRERWSSPDADFIDVDFLPPAHANGVAPPLLVLFHGLEGSSASHYAQAFADFAQAQGWAYAVPHFRGCSGEINHAPRAYHSGDYAEIDWILQRLRARAAAPLLVVGVSLGGNAVLRWAQEMGSSAAPWVQALAAISAPVDLAASGTALGQGLNRQLYTRIFLHSMKAKALAKLAQFPGLFEREALLAVRDVYQFDQLFTAPLHGFRSTEDYWRRASAKPQLAAIQIPTLLLNARNDPLVPAASLPQMAAVGRCVTLWQPAQGGHVGFALDSQAMPEAVGAWLAAQGRLQH